MDKLAQVHEESQANEVRIRENHKKQVKYHILYNDTI